MPEIISDLPLSDDDRRYVLVQRMSWRTAIIINDELVDQGQARYDCTEESPMR